MSTAVLAQSRDVELAGVTLVGRVQTGANLLEASKRTGYTFVVEFLVESLVVAINDDGDLLARFSGRRYLASGALGTSSGAREFAEADLTPELRRLVALLVSQA